MISNNKFYLFSACPPGKWGDDCGNECPCLNGAQCDPLSGDCTCTPGWHGNEIWFVLIESSRLENNLIIRSFITNSE